MSKSIPLHLTDDVEEMINIILKETDDFESEASLIRICVKKYLKEKYPEILLKNFEDEE